MKLTETVKAIFGFINPEKAVFRGGRMKKKLAILAFLGGLVVFGLRRLKQGAKELIAADPQMEFWAWLCEVWEECTSLDQYVRNDRGFGNKVWEDGIERHLKGLFHVLNHFPSQSVRGFSADFAQRCQDIQAKALLEWAELEKLILEQNREGMKERSVHLVNFAVELTELADEMKKVRLRQGVV